MVSAGRVLLMPKDDYNPATTYEMLDIVSYNGSSYIAKKSTTGNLPTNTTYWQLNAYGGSAANLAGNFATLETTAYASQNYAIDDFLVDKDNQFCKVIASITSGDELVLDTNIEATDVGELIQSVISYADGLDAKNVKLNGAVAITVQTDLDNMTTPGNYYKSATNIYVTNAPTGIDSEVTAIFRLTVENGSDITDKYIQTLRTNDGKIYTRAYDGSDWSTWVELASAASVSALDTAKQPKTLDTPITVGGTQQTTVEGALSSLNSALSNKADSSKAYQTDDTTETTLASDDVLPFYDTSATAKRKMTVQKFGEQLISNPNLLDNPWFTVNQRGANSYSALGYTVDRWAISYWVNGSSFGVDENGINISCVNAFYLVEGIENDDVVHKIVTASLMFSDGSILSGTGVFPSSSDSSDTLKIAENDNVAIYLQQRASLLGGKPNYTIEVKNGKSVAIRAAKLELGSVSTLAMDTAPNYATELLKCQRYFVRYLSPDNSGAVIGVGHYSANTNARITIPLPTSMRAKPSIVVSDLSKFRIVVNDGTNTPTAAQVSGIQNNLVAVNFTTREENNNLLATLNRTSQGAYIDFAADL